MTPAIPHGQRPPPFLSLTRFAIVKKTTPRFVPFRRAVLQSSLSLGLGESYRVRYRDGDRLEVSSA